MSLHLVTGGSGYFGEVLVQKLLDRNETVRVFDVNPISFSRERLEFVQGDIRDLMAIRRATEGVKVVHHNVAQVPLAKDKHLFWSVNRDGTRNMLEAALSAGVRKAVYTSSSAVFGVPARNPITDDTPPNPQEDYGRAKLAGETLCEEYRQMGVEVSVLRPRTVVGHGRLGIFQILFEWIYQNQNIPVLGPGDNIYQFIHADDLAEACIAAGERPGSSVYNVGAEKFGTMREMLEGLIAHAGTKSRVRSVPMRAAILAMNAAGALGLSPLGPYHSLMYGRSMYFDISTAMRELNWAPRYNSLEMFCESYDWYCAHRESIPSGFGSRSKHQSAIKQGVLALLRYVL